jgi:beta-mannosidase
MDLKLDDFAGLGWPEKWREVTNLNLILRNPYGGGPVVTDSLRDYIAYLETEHALADHHALANLRLRSPSCAGIINWPLNKGAPLFEFGCVDYRGYPLANYYAVKRLFADIAIGIYRDIGDIRVVGSNLGRAAVRGQLRLTHVDAAGAVLGQWTHAVSLAAGENGRLAEIPDYYARIADRRREVIRAELTVDGKGVSEETLFFCPLSDFVQEADAIRATASRAGDGWDLSLTASSVVKMVRIEGNQKWLLSDNYFALVPGGERRLHARLLERTDAAAPTVTISATGSSERHTLVLTDR